MPIGDYVKNWRARYFKLTVRPFPTLAYYRDARRQQHPTQTLPLRGARVEVRSSPDLQIASSNAAMLQIDTKTHTESQGGLYS